MNNPSGLDLTRQWVPLDSRSAPTILVYGEDLAKQLLNSDLIKSYNLMVYWKLVAKIPYERLPAIETLFQNTPMFLHGEQHAESRKKYIPFYKAVESNLDAWLPGCCDAFFDRFNSNQKIDPKAFVDNFLESLSRQLFASSLGCKSEDLENFPKTIFRMLARAPSLRQFDQHLERLTEKAGKILSASGRNPEEAWALASISVMGREPLRGALLYGLLSFEPGENLWTAEKLLHASSPVSILGREVVKDCEIADLKFKTGQLIHICPFLVHLRSAHQARQCSETSANEKETSFTFGFGSHVCPGRKMSISIVRAFLQQLYRRPNLLFDTSKLRLMRDFTLTYPEVAESTH